MTDCATLVAAGWNDHGDRPAEVAERIPGFIGRSSPPTMRSRSRASRRTSTASTSAAGARASRCSTGSARCRCARRTFPAGALRRHVAMLRFASGDGDALAPTRSPTIASPCSRGASAALAGRQSVKPAVTAYTDALALAHEGLAAGSPAVRALAVGGNNLACHARRAFLA